MKFARFTRTFSRNIGTFGTNLSELFPDLRIRHSKIGEETSKLVARINRFDCNIYLQSRNQLIKVKFDTKERPKYACKLQGTEINGLVCQILHHAEKKLSLYQEIQHSIEEEYPLSTSNMKTVRKSFLKGKYTYR